MIDCMTFHTGWRASIVSTVMIVLGAVGLGGCRNDPVPQAIIDGLGEEQGEPSATHRAGQPCLACHTNYEGAQPTLVVAGTLFGLDAMNKVVAAPKVLVTIYDSSGDTRKACSNTSGNFFIKQEDWEDLTYPLAVQVGNRTMRSLIGRDGSCAGCHFVSEQDNTDPVTGAGRDSPGLILLNPVVTDPTCGG